MPWNGSGIYITPAGQPVVTGTVISSATFNTLVTDLANTLNNVVTRDGQGALTTVLKLQDGSVTIPGLTFNAESSTGLYRPSTGVFGLTVQGVQAMSLTSAGVSIPGTLGVTGTSAHTGAATFASTVGVTGVITATGGVVGNVLGTLTGHGTLDLALTGGALSGAVTTTSTITSSNSLGLNVDTASTTAALIRAINSGGTMFVGMDSSTGGSFGSAYSANVWNSAATPLNFATNNTIRMTVDSSGNVGIGATSISKRLQLGNGANASEMIRFAGSGASFDIGTTASGMEFTTGNNQPFIFTNNAVERMRIAANGNVGIGGASGGNKLEVTGTFAVTGNSGLPSTTGGGLIFDYTPSTSRTYIGDGTGYSWNWAKRTGSVTTDLVAVTDTGNLTMVGSMGIGGTVAGGYKLYVAGDQLVGPAGGTPGKTRYQQWSNYYTDMGIDSSGIGFINSVINGAAGTLSFRRNGTESMQIDSLGRVGINATPSTALTVGGSLTISSGSSFWGSVTAASPAASYMTFNRGTSIGGVLGYIGSDGGGAVSGGTGTGFVIRAEADLVFSPGGGTERMRLTSAGVIQDAAGNELGYKGLPAASVTTGAFAAADRGKCVYATGGVTAPNSTMAQGDVVTILNTTGSAITITATVATMRQAGTANTGNRTLAAYSIATILFASSTLGFISGTGLS